MMSGIRTPWRAVAAMFAMNGALYGMWAARVPAVAEKFDLSHAVLGGLLLLLAGGAILAFPFAGRAADQMGAARVTLWLALANLVTLLLIGIAPSFWVLAPALLLFGASHGAMDVTMNTWATEVERTMARPVMSSFHAMWSVGTAMGAISGYLALKAQLGLLPHFAAAGLMLSALFYWFGSINWQSDTHHGAQKGPIFTLPKGILLFAGLMAFGAAMGEGAMADWSAVYMVDVAGVSEADAALGFTVFSGAMVAMRLAGDRVIRAFGPVATARGAGVVAFSGAVLVVGFATPGISVLGFALMGLGYAVVIPIAFSRAANDPNMSPGRAISSVSTLSYGGILLGPPLIGFVAEASSLRFGFGILAALALLIICFAFAVRPVVGSAVTAKAAK
ncbi:Inner membrane protein YbjJ [Thalassovita autumnalis]|uniref:Inner membrane protein YbjJ n=2 Tax=Thalassovita autumnalis TaxID=2072972 RepID=A0A0P1FVQ9_9RHOB|nr:Inner membrane protein YbjJ [Thalassovita autumnalis]CUH72933.1 Inner membrane protein YbjJ [Thalassovita autumnalis]